MSNQIKTVFFLTLLTLLIIALGGMFGGRAGMIMALLLAGAMNFISYWFSAEIVLKMYRAEKITFSDAPDLYGLVKKLADKAGLPMPTAIRP